ncbi:MULTISPECIES: helix-turn-helix domain-containing protein [Methylorubrum]
MTRRRVDTAHKLLTSGTPAREIALTIGVSVATLYRHPPAPVQETISVRCQNDL